MKRPQTISRAKPMHTAVYMEVYSSNRVIYRVTAGAVAGHGKTRPAYGVILDLKLYLGFIIKLFAHRRDPDAAGLLRESGTNHCLCQ